MNKIQLPSEECALYNSTIIDIIIFCKTIIIIIIMPPTVAKGEISVAFVRPSASLSVRPSRT